MEEYKNVAEECQAGNSPRMGWHSSGHPANHAFDSAQLNCKSGRTDFYGSTAPSRLLFSSFLNVADLRMNLASVTAGRA